MRVPATSTFFIAVFASLSCRGTSFDTVTKTLEDNNNVSESGSQPILNKLYLMLYSVLDKHNQTKLPPNFDQSELELMQDFNPTYETNISFPRSIYNNQSSNTFYKESNFGASEENAMEINLRIEKKLKKRGGVAVKEIDRNFTKLIKSSVDMTTGNHSGSFATDKKKKPAETGSSAPLLNYIFDTYSNTHYHKDGRVGMGNSIYAATSAEVEAFVGSTAYLDCKVDAHHDKLVSWVRRKSDDEPMDLLTTGTQQYTADDRYSARFIPPDIWRLEVANVRPSDAANYDCQLSAHPPRTARVTLLVPEVSVLIVDGAGAELSEQVCEVGSTVALRCEVRGLRMEGGPSLLWYRRDLLLNDDTTRGGISVRTEFGANGANSVLRVARVQVDDAGRYTCSVARSPQYTPPPANVVLHVIKGESLAELHQSGGTAVFAASTILAVTLALWTLCF